jgi:hypothetical protein
MKKCLVVLTAIVALVLFAPMASASFLTGYLPCGAVGSIAGQSTFLNTTATTGNVSMSGAIATITCPDYTAPAGDYISAVDLRFYGDASAPLNSSSVITDTWTYISGPIAFVTSTDSVIASSDHAFAACLGNTGAFTGQTCDIFVDTPENVTGAFGVEVVSVQAVPTSGGVAATGNTNANLSIQYEYSSNAPEPATLSLMGGALLGLGLFGKKLFRR